MGFVILSAPTGWVELERHLLDDHDLPVGVVDDPNFDADAARRTHAELHRPNTHLNWGGRPKPHAHG